MVHNQMFPAALRIYLSQEIQILFAYTATRFSPVDLSIENPKKYENTNNSIFKMKDLMPDAFGVENALRPTPKITQLD